MKIIKTISLSLLGASSFLAMMAVTATPASAQATRTWVSGVGDDVNPCSRTAPCKTFSGAISKTAAGGEINCLDPGGFGAVSIIKSMTIACPYTEGGALAGGNGITVNLPASTDVVFIRGLDIFGVNPPTNGIRFIGQGTLFVQDSVIRRFNAANSQGISFQPSGVGKLYVSNTTIADNGNAATGGGILIQPTAAGVGRVTLQNVRVQNNANAGVRVDTSTTSGFVLVTIEGSYLDGSVQGISVNAPVAGSADVMVSRSHLFSNTSFGITANGVGGRVRVANTVIFGNGTSMNPAGGSFINDHGGNLVLGNSSNTPFN